MYFAYGVPSNFFQVSSHSSTWVSASMIGIVTSPILYINVNKIVQTSRVDFENSPPYSSGLRSPSNIGRGRLNGYTLDCSRLKTLKPQSFCRGRNEHDRRNPHHDFRGVYGRVSHAHSSARAAYRKKARYRCDLDRNR